MTILLHILGDIQERIAIIENNLGITLQLGKLFAFRRVLYNDHIRLQW